MNDTSRPLWDKTLESRGPDAVRGLLAISPGPGAGSIVRGLGDSVDDMPTRIYAENWLASQDADRDRRKERLENSRHWWTRGISFLALILSFLAWFFPRK